MWSFCLMKWPNEMFFVRKLFHQEKTFFWITYIECSLDVSSEELKLFESVSTNQEAPLPPPAGSPSLSPIPSPRASPILRSDPSPTPDILATTETPPVLIDVDELRKIFGDFHFPFKSL